MFKLKIWPTWIMSYKTDAFKYEMRLWNAMIIAGILGFLLGVVL